MRLKVLFDPATGESTIVNARNGDVVEDVKLSKESIAVLNSAIVSVQKARIMAISLAELSVSISNVEVSIGVIPKPEATVDGKKP